MKIHGAACLLLLLLAYSSWGYYRLSCKAPEGQRGMAILSKTGEIKSSWEYPDRERS